MSRKTLLYYLFSANKKPLYQDANGFVQEGDGNYNKAHGQPAHLEYAPDGWQGALVKYARNIKYWGLFREMTVPMKFVGDGAAILKDRMWGPYSGIETVCHLGIAKLDRTESAYNYKNWYLSEINFAKYKEASDGVNVEALEGGLVKYLKANENTVYEIPIDTDPEAINILFDGMLLDCTLNFSTFNGEEGKGYHLVPISYISGEGTRISLVPNPDIILGGTAANNYQSTSQDWFVSAFANTTIKKISGNIRLFTGGANSGSYTLTLRTSTNRTLSIYSSNINVPATTISFDSTFTLNEGENLFMEANWTGRNPIAYGEAEFKVQFSNKFKPTMSKALYAYRVLEKLVEKMTDGRYTVSSSFLKSLKTVAILSGDALRGLDNSVIKTSLADFFKSLNHYSIALDCVNDKLVIERFANFFKSTIIADIGQVTDATVEVAEDIFFNTIKAGGKTIEYEDVNGRSEFTQGQQWTTPVTKIIKELDLTRPYRTDPYGIEFTRMNLDGKKTTDSKSDNDTFMVHIEASLQSGNPDYYKLNRPNYIITGVPDPVGVFNIEFSPKRTLLNNGAFIHSVLDKLDSQKIKFTSADKNADLSTTLGGTTVTEKADIQNGSLAARLFKPYYFLFKTEVPLNLVDLLNSNPYGKVKFTWNDRQWYGYLVDGGIKPADNDVQQWKLLCAPENDIKYFNS